jgi:hypothetical protein
VRAERPRTRRARVVGYTRETTLATDLRPSGTRRRAAESAMR